MCESLIAAPNSTLDNQAWLYQEWARPLLGAQGSCNLNIIVCSLHMLCSPMPCTKGLPNQAKLACFRWLQALPFNLIVLNSATLAPGFHHCSLSWSPTRAMLLQVLVNMLDFGMQPQAALDAPRFYIEGVDTVLGPQCVSEST